MATLGFLFNQDIDWQVWSGRTEYLAVSLKIRTSHLLIPIGGLIGIVDKVDVIGRIIADKDRTNVLECQAANR